MKITDIITKENLNDPYDRLSDFLDLSDIIKLEQEYRGRRIQFRRDCEDVKTEYPELSAMLGIQKASLVINALGDMRIYFHSLRKNTLDTIRSQIIKEFNGYNYCELSKRFGYTERHIRRIISDAGMVRSKNLDNRQLSLFEAE